MSQDMSRFPEKWPTWEDTREPNFDDDYDDAEEMIWEAEQERRE